MMTKLPSMPFFPADFFADTAHMTPCAAHAYLFLLGHAWLRGAKLPNDEVALWRMARVRADQWNKIKSEIMPLWKLGQDGFLRNSRLTDEWVYVDEKRTRLSANGALGGRPKSLKYHEIEKANGFPTKTKPKAPIPIPIKKESFNSELRQEAQIVSQEQRDRCVKLARETAAAMRMRKDGKAWPTSDTKK